MTDASAVPSGQLPLQVSLPDDARLAALYPGPNAWLLDWLQYQWLQSTDPNDTSMVLEGSPGSGLTYLLQALCHHAEDADLSVFYLNLSDLAGHEPSVLEDMAHFPVLCLDDVDHVLGQPAWEAALFHLFNRQREQGHRLVIGLHQGLESWRDRILPDLFSRFTWGLRVQVKLPQDEDWVAGIQWLADQRGLSINLETARYLALRGPRDWHGLANVMTALDTAALAAKRRVTQPFIRSVMGW